MRRYDVDTIRVFALCLLIFYHIAIGFQPWGTYIFFVTNDQSLEFLWPFMEIFNIWRIPILFVVSGMGVGFALERRTWKQLLWDRTTRILAPLIFGSFFIVPIFWAIFFTYYAKPQVYLPNPGHLWFLGNIFLYVLVLLPLCNYLKNHPDNKLLLVVSIGIGKPLGILPIFALPMMLEAVLVAPPDYASFALEPLHGFLVGIICFFSGFIFVSLKEECWEAVKKVKYRTSFLAVLFCLVRFLDLELFDSILFKNLLVSFESTCWILASFGLGATYLNRPSKLLAYLGSAVYPVYIVHLPIQFFFSSLVFPLSVLPQIKFVFVLLTTYCGSVLIFEIVKRLRGLRVLLGIRV